ncbi:extracellular solute-binding protein [Paenibacillus pinisoli]|uniref:Extracellular solute-binding protein n=1 Tax=Paenibacillus pinisoli TaxID=1276110 RepID=A0A3A6PG43_9BACL|nr:extracellular solute-binding protein [Paenibacillus pinisoli]RJX38656.1 extracellular solute-binding protein [Paenibacillus pinisoli]
MKKNNKNRFVSILCLILIVAMIVGCSNNSGGKSPQSSSGTDGEGGKPVKIVYLTPGDSAAKPIQPDDRIIAEINKRLGIELEIKFVPEGGFEKVNVAMATGDFPDLVTAQYPSSSLSQWMEEGLLVPLNDYLPQMPTVKEKLEGQFSWTAVDGNYYGYPFIEEKSNVSMTYRADWLKTLNIAPPTTLDEFYEALKAITNGDPDQNGQKDTYGLTGTKENGFNTSFNFVFYAYGLPYGDWILDNDGKVAPVFEHPAFKSGVEYIQKLWKEKLIDPEFLLNDTQQREQKFFQSKAGFMVANLFRHVNRLEKSLKELTPAGELGFINPPAGPEGKHGMVGKPKGGLFTAITTKAKDPEKAAQFLEFMLSPEGRELLELGIEGVHYTKDGDKVNYNEEERAKDNFASNGWSHPLAWGNVVWPLTRNYLPNTEAQADRAKESVEIATSNLVPNLVNVTTPEEIEMGGVFGKGILSELANQYYFDMISGKVDIDKGLAELSKKWREQGGDKVLAAVNAAYEAQQK